MDTKLPQLLRDTLPHSLDLDWEKFSEAQSLPPVNSIRINPRKYLSQFDKQEHIPWCKNGRYLAERPSFTFDPLFHAGAYYVQEASSMFLEYAIEQHIDLNKTLSVLDLCAAPGGKSTHIASLISDGSLLISNEVIGTRVNILVENIVKWGYANTWVSNNDPAHFSRTPAFFDLLLVDAPCSGSGLFRKIPDYAADWNPDLVNLCAQRQKRILHDSYKALTRDGVLVYMTCSLSEQENEMMLDHMMQHFDLESLKINIPDSWGVVETRSAGNAYGYRFFPHLLKGEGFFIALFKKKDGELKNSFAPRRKNAGRSIDTGPFFDAIGFNIHLQGDLLIAIDEAQTDHFDYLSGNLKLVKKGMLIGKRLPKEIIPSHELALYANNNNYEFILDVHLEQALSFLKKETFFIPLEKKGWYLVSYKGHNLGWIKNLGNRFNNYYPNNSRILSRQDLSL